MKSKRQQILFIEHILWGGGQEKITYNLAHLLDPRKFECHIAYLNHRDNVPVSFDPCISIHCLDPLLQNEGISKAQAIRQNILKFVPRGVTDRLKRIIHKSGRSNVVENASPPFDWYFSIYRNYLNGLREILSRMEENTLVVSFQETPVILAWLNQIYANNKYISFLCVPESIYLPFLFPDKDRYQFENWIFGNACRGSARVTVPNDWIGNDMQNQFDVPLSRIRKIYNPIDCASILKQSEIGYDLIVDHQVTTLFVQLARLDLQKNHDLTVQACEILRQRYDNFVVCLIGDGSEKERIQKLVVEKGLQKHIIFLGALANPYPYLKKARASLLTSSFEASPLTLVESMYLGAVPISVDCIAGPAEQLGQGRFGILTPPNDSVAFADAMYRIATDDALWSKLRLEGMENAVNYDIANFIRIWNDMLLEVSAE